MLQRLSHRRWRCIERLPCSGGILLTAVCLGSVGCGGHDFTVAPVSGKVTCQGEPVTQGRVIFNPIAEGTTQPGRPAMGVIQSDGSFVLTTYDEGDGAIIGRHQVSIFLPSADEEDEEEAEEEGRQLYEIDCPIPDPEDWEVEIPSDGTDDLVLELDQ